MPKYFAFLRAINVGGHSVKMDALRILFEGCGCTNVDTFIASGNVIFESGIENPEELTQIIESYLLQKLGYSVAVFLRTPADLESIVGYQPFVDPGEATIYIAFLSTSPDEISRDRLYSNNSADNRFQIHRGEVYWLCRTRFSDSVFSGAQLEKTLGMQATIRNISTLNKIVQNYINPE